MNGSAFLTQSFLDRMDQGIIPWHQTWTPGFTAAASYASGRPYPAYNQWLLLHKEQYISVKRAISLGTDFKGAHKEFVVWGTWVEKDTDRIDPETGEPIKKRSYIWGTHPVFPLSEVRDKETGAPLEPSALPDNVANPAARINLGLERIISEYTGTRGIAVHPSLGARKPSFDGKAVIMPHISLFESPAAYYVELFRQLVSSTGEMLERKSHADSIAGDARAAAREELVKEMGAAMLASAFGLDTDEVFDNSAGYIQKWRDRLKADNGAVLFAARAAEKAVNVILGIQEQGLETETVS